MNIHLATSVACILDELYCVVEHTRNVFSDTVFEAVTLVVDTFALVVVFTVVSCSIHNMGYSNLLEHRPVFSHDVRSQVEEIIYDFRTDSFVKFVLVFFAAGPLEVEIFICQLVWRNFKSVEIAGCGVPLALSL